MDYLQSDFYQRIQEIVAYEWLGLKDVDKIQTVNPFANRTEWEIEHPHEFLINFMRQPENFYLTCKHILNITLCPFQLAVLRELWVRPFPMLISTRGGSKSFMLGLYAILRMLFCQGVKVVVVGASFRQSKVVYEYMENIWYNAPVLRDICSGTDSKPRRDIDLCRLSIGESICNALPIGDGCTVGSSLITDTQGIRTIASEHNGDEEKSIIARDKYVWGNGKFVWSDEAYCNGLAKTKKIVTVKGYEIEGTLNHQIKILWGGHVVWRRLDELATGDRVLIDRTPRWHTSTENVSTDEAYALGLMLGNGWWTNEYRIGYAGLDLEPVAALEKVFGAKFTSYDGLHHHLHSKEKRREWRQYWGLDVAYAPDKKIPEKMLRASKEAMAACLSGLFDTDGTLQVATEKGGTAITVSFCTTSDTLAKQVQYLLLHFGIIAYKNSRKRDERWYTAYELILTGKDAVRFHKEIGFKLERKRTILVNAIKQKKREVSIGDEVPGIRTDMIEFCDTHRVEKGRNPKHLHEINAVRFRKRKAITQDCARLFVEKYSHLNHPFVEHIRNIADKNVYYDKVAEITDGEAVTYDMHVPDTHEYCVNGFFSHNTKIRGQRANVILAEEAASLMSASRDIFENVVSGFASVSMNPVDKMQETAKKKALHRMGLLADVKKKDIPIPGLETNQTVLCGTAYYSFNPLCDYWKRYKAIVESRGDQERLLEIFDGEIPANFDARDYSVMRIPYDMLPDGFMDEKNIAKAKATQHSVSFLLEYNAVFAGDSDGFFKRSLVESCVVGKHTNIITKPSCGEVRFNAVLRGHPARQYVMAIDPASEQDNFAIVILELWSDHRRVVYCWTTNKKHFKTKQKKGVTNAPTFYAFAARKVRELMRLFPCERVAFDAQGGGVHIYEALNDPSNMLPGDDKVYPVIEPDKPQDTDGMSGQHLIELIQFAKAEWVSNANHGMKKDFEDKALLFPEFSPAVVGLAFEEDKMRVEFNADGEAENLLDSLELNIMNIEEIKDELSSVVHTQTSVTGRESWDTPSVKEPGGKKGRLRKDRYSALLMANAVGRLIQRTVTQPEYQVYGGFAHILKDQKKRDDKSPAYSGPQWFTRDAEQAVKAYRSVRRTV